jgi:hypothetical protein
MASRKNFPGRLEERRLRAAQRNAPQSQPVPQNDDLPLLAGSEQRRARVDQSVSIAKTIETSPIPPTLKEFGLSENDLNRLPKPWFRNSIPGSREVYTFIVLDILVFLLLLHRGIHLSFGYIVGFFGFSFISVIPFMILWVMMGFFERQLYSALNDQFARYSNYQKAFAAFGRRKQEYDTRVAKQRAEYWRSLSGVAFERELGKLFSLMGYAVTYTPSTADWGVDLCLRKDGKLTVVQCKAHTRRIPFDVAQRLSASMVDFQADNGIIACFEGVTTPAADYIKSKRITVMTLREIVAHQTAYG